MPAARTKTTFTSATEAHALLEVLFEYIKTCALLGRYSYHRAGGGVVLVNIAWCEVGFINFVLYYCNFIKVIQTVDKFWPYLMWVCCCYGRAVDH